MVSAVGRLESAAAPYPMPEVTTKLAGFSFNIRSAEDEFSPEEAAAGSTMFAVPVANVMCVVDLELGPFVAGHLKLNRKSGRFSTGNAQPLLPDAVLFKR